MRFITEYRSRAEAERLAREIEAACGGRRMAFMEVCGTHTMSIARFGLRRLLPQSIELISGPGCPVCVTPTSYIDRAARIAALPGVIACTFGDMMRVPGSDGSLESARAGGCDVRPVYSTMDALSAARSNPKRQVVFMGVGFETTAPTVAASILAASEEGIENYSVLSAHKLVPPALGALLEGGAALDGLILPGHVSAVIGAAAYRPLLARHRIPGAIAGFEPTDILSAILALVRMASEQRPGLAICYGRAVSEEGNRRALAAMARTFEPCASEWRGLGEIPESGLAIREEFSAFDAAKRFPVELPPAREDPRCICGKILSGKARPMSCPLFGNACTPERPAGACMVSSEGSCAAEYRYGPA